MALGYICLTPLPPDNTDGFSYTSIVWITLAGGGCQATFLHVTVHYTPHRFIQLLRARDRS
jgi:hypothetical protein